MLHTLVVGFITLLVCAAGLAATIVVGRLRRHRVGGRRARQADELRPTILALTAGEPDEITAATTELVRLEARRWRAVRPIVLGLLGKVRGEAHQALVRVLADRGAIEAAITRVIGRGRVARAEAAELLGESGAVEALPQLVALLADNSSEVRQVGARALGRLADPAVIGPLFATLGSDKAIPPRLIAAAVGRVGVSAHPEVQRALRTGNAKQRAVAADVAGMVGATNCLGLLVHTLEADPIVEVRIHAARAVGRLGLPWVVPSLVAATAADQVAGLRAVATRALGEIGSEDVVGPLAALACDPHDRVAVNAARALTQCGSTGARALAELAADPTQLHAREALLSAGLRGDLPLPVWAS